MLKIKGVLGKTAAVTGACILSASILALLGSMLKSAPNDLKIILAYTLMILTAAVYAYFAPRLGDAAVFASVWALSFLFQTVFSYNTVLPGEGDLQHYFSNAAAMTNGGFSLPSLYSATFPGTVTYPAVLALFMNIFGVHRLVPVILNQIAVSAAVAAVYLFMKDKTTRGWALGCSMLMALHPYVIIYANTCNAELLYGCCALFSFMAFDRALNQNAVKRQYLWYAVSAFLCGLSTLFRPLAVILAAALILYLFLFHEGKILTKAVASAMLFAALGCFGLINNAIVNNITGYGAPSSSYGWNLYVGGSETGRWNQPDGEEFNAVIKAASSPSEIQEYFAEKAWERYKNMGAGIFVHGLKKVRFWESAQYMADQAARQGEGTRFDTRQSRGVYLALIALAAVPVFIAGLAACVMALLYRRKGRADSLAALSLYITGTFIALAFLEIAPRYTVSYYITLCIPAVWMAFTITNTLRAGQGFRSVLSIPRRSRRPR